MNYLDSSSLLTRRPLSRAPDLKKERIFGANITNALPDRSKLNQSSQQNTDK